MKKIRIHRFNNEQWGRAHLPFFKTFDNYLKNFFDVESINYNKDGNTFTGNIKTLRKINSFGNKPPLSDVDCVIENLQNGDIKVLSFGEYFLNFVVHFAKSDVCSKVLLSHFNWHNLYYWMKRENAVSEISKVRPWIFLPFMEFDYHLYRNKKDKNDNLDERMYWQGSGVDDYRQCIRILEKEGYLQPIVPMDYMSYLNKMSESKIGVSYYQTLDRYRTPYDYPGEFCYREIEYISIGLPFIRIEYKDTVHDPLLANVHYISIPRDVANVAFEKNGERGIADLFIQRYNEVINDEEFLNYISKNQKEWFDRNIMSPNREKLTFDLLGLEEWLNIPDDIQFFSNETPDNSEIIEKNNLELDFSNENIPRLFEEFILFLKEKNNLSEQKKTYNISENNTKESETIKPLDDNKYKNYVLQQSRNVFDVFREFLNKVKPKRILEIGTGGGGLTLFMRDCLNEIGLQDTEIKTFDTKNHSYYETLRENNIEVIIDNLFNEDYTDIIKPNLIENFVKKDGITIVLCDGGNKINEFNLLSKIIKPGDYILAHDYCFNKEVFEKEIYNKIWNWCEIMESDIEKSSEQENLFTVDYENFSKVVWICKQKKY